MQLVLIDINVLSMRKNHSDLFSANTRRRLVAFVHLFLFSCYYIWWKAVIVKGIVLRGEVEGLDTLRKYEDGRKEAAVNIVRP